MKTWGYSRQREQPVQIPWGGTCSESEFWVFPFHFAWLLQSLQPWHCWGVPFLSSWRGNPCFRGKRRAKRKDTGSRSHWGSGEKEWPWSGLWVKGEGRRNEEASHLSPRPQNSGEAISPLIPIKHVAHCSLQLKAALSTWPRCLRRGHVSVHSQLTLHQGRNLVAKVPAGKSSSFRIYQGLHVLWPWEVVAHMGPASLPRQEEDTHLRPSPCLRSQRRGDAPSASCFEGGLLPISHESARLCIDAGHEIPTRVPKPSF